MINHGIKRLKLAASGEDFFQVIPDELPQGDLTAWRIIIERLPDVIRILPGFTGKIWRIS